MTTESWFAELYRGCYRRLVLTAYGMTGDLGAAEEITQEAFTVAYVGALGERDDGRTWQTGELDLGSTVPASDGWDVVERNGVMYATASTYGGLLGVWVSTDDGRSWTRTWTRDGTRWLPDLVGSPIAAGDGSLVLSDGTTTYVSTDQGRSFEPAGTAGGSVEWTRAGYLRENGDTFALSSDGLRWREFTVR